MWILFSTDAQTLDATVRLTNIEFTTDLQNSSSEAYRNLTEGIVAEVGIVHVVYVSECEL